MLKKITQFSDMSTSALYSIFTRKYHPWYSLELQTGTLTTKSFKEHCVCLCIRQTDFCDLSVIYTLFCFALILPICLLHPAPLAFLANFFRGLIVLDIEAVCTQEPCGSQSFLHHIALELEKIQKQKGIIWAITSSVLMWSAQSL